MVRVGAKQTSVGLGHPLISLRSRRVPCTMRYRLPLELELTILELAAPPLAIDSLHDRVAFFITVSLVHRSFTAWAQDRLRDQFLYTYRPRNGEYARLERRLTEGGYGANCPILRLTSTSLVFAVRSTPNQTIRMRRRLGTRQELPRPQLQRARARHRLKARTTKLSTATGSFKLACTRRRYQVDAESSARALRSGA